MKTLLIIYPGKNVYSDCVFNLFVADTGEHLASHYCSNYSFAKGDLYDNRPERKTEYTERFGDVEVKYIDDSGVTIEQLVERNKDFYKDKK